MQNDLPIFKQLPWVGGLNTSQDESIIPPNQLTRAENVVFGTNGARKKRDGINHNYDSASAGTNDIIAGHDYWFGTTSKDQRQVTIDENGAMYSYNAGTRTTLTVGGTAWTGPLTSACFLTFGNYIAVAVSGATNVMKYWDGNTANSVIDVPGSPPKASIMREHLGRIFCNDKTNQDRLHYCPTGDPTQWNGIGDSGAIPIMEGDGDPVGINAIFPTFKGALFVAKKTKIYKIDGYTPEEFFVTKVTDGIGCISHNSIAPVDQDDMVFVSQKGIHSLAATQNYGDFNSTFLSTDIQKTFNESFNQSRLSYVRAAYLPNLNSVAFAFSESNSSTNNSLYFYNIPNKSWYNWPSLSCQSIWVANDSDKKRLYLGTTEGRISKTLNGTNYDISSSGTNTAISFRVTTGIIYPNNEPELLNGYKQFILYFKPQGTFNLAATITIDGKTLDTTSNSLSYVTSTGIDLLNSTFTLGTSQLGYNGVMGAYGLTIDGVGKGFKVEITSSGINEAIEIQGFGVRYEPLGKIMEVI